MKRRGILSHFVVLAFSVALFVCLSAAASATEYTAYVERQQTTKCTMEDTVVVKLDKTPYKCEWSWDDGNAADIQNKSGWIIVTPRNSGTVTVTASVDEYGTGSITVYHCYIEIAKINDYFSFSKSSYNLDVDESVELSFRYGPNSSSSELDFSSSDSSIASVSDSGKVTAKKEGSVTITGRYGDVKDTCEVYVGQTDTGSLTLSSSKVTLEVGEEKHIKVDSWNDEDLRWSSSDEDVATVDSDGYVTAKKAGTATITAKVRDDTSQYGNCRVTVSGTYKGKIEYTVVSNGRLNFELGKFNNFSQDLCASDLEYIRFTSIPSTSRGTLYYRYDSVDDKKTVTTDKEEKYYTSGSSIISDLTFIPQLNITGTVEYEFTARSKNEKNLEGTIRIEVSAPKNASAIVYSTTGTLPARFKYSDFEKACSDRGAGAFSTVRFILPGSNVGTLCYDYLSPLRYTAVSATGDYGKTGNLLDSVSFVPVANSSGNVTIQYTGTDAAGVTYDGTITIMVTNNVSNVSIFTDVKQNEYYAQPVAWAIEKGITKGTSATTFSPDDTCTRVQILTFLWRSYGTPVPGIANPFTNLPNNLDYQSASLWAYQNNMLTGNRLDPDAPCTRGEVAKYLWILAGRPASAATQFTDVLPTADYAQAVSWAYAQGVTDGTSATTFSPSATCTRAQIATFLWRYVGHQVLK